MFSIATDISLMGYEVNVFPDHWYLGKDNFKVNNIFSPKIFRQYIKKFFLNLVNHEETLIICDTWKSVNAIPKKFNVIYVGIIDSKANIAPKVIKIAGISVGSSFSPG